MAARPRVHLIATGGTIAGTAPDPTDTRRYTAGVLSAEQLLGSVPAIAELADITVQQLYNLDSKDMTPEHWLGLARATQAAVARGDVDGVVITHGTDTMEESAFFLDLVLPPGKPVVFTGAMRPATALSADGPMNLFHACSVAASELAAGRGVLVVMDGVVHAARSVTKITVPGSHAFSSGCDGIVGTVDPLQLGRDSRRRSAVGCPIDLRSLPRVDIVGIAAGADSGQLTACRMSGAEGIVVACLGHMSLPGSWLAAIREAISQGVPIVCAPRASVSGFLGAAGLMDGWLPVTCLPPTKARVALAAAIAGLSEEFTELLPKI